MADLAELCRQHRHGDAWVLLTTTLDVLTLPSAEQAQVAGLELGLLEKARPAREATHDVLRALSDGLARSRLDPARVDAAIARLVAASSALQEAARDHVVRLHRLLSPLERQALADELATHEAAWRACNASDRADLLTISAELRLSPSQQEQLSQALPARVSAGNPIAQLAAAFPSDGFAAKAEYLIPGDANLEIESWKNLVRFCQRADPLLADQQRHRLGRLLRRLEHRYEAGRVLE